MGVEGFAVDASLIAADSNKQRSVPGEAWRADRCASGRAGVSGDPRRCRLRRGERGDPKIISRSDPAAQWTGAHKGHAFFAWAVENIAESEIALQLHLFQVDHIADLGFLAGETVVQSK